MALKWSKTSDGVYFASIDGFLFVQLYPLVRRRKDGTLFPKERKHTIVIQGIGNSYVIKHKYRTIAEAKLAAANVAHIVLNSCLAKLLR